MNLRDIASKVKGYIQSKTQDDEGWIRQGNFTPVKEAKSRINYQMQNSPVNRALYTAIGTAGRPVVNSLANIGALGTTALGSAQMAFNRPESALKSFDTATKLRQFAGTQGSFDQGTGWNTIKKGGLDAVQTALTGKGLKYVNPTNLGISGLLSGTISKATGGDFATGFGQGMGNTPQIMGFVGASNPLLNKLIPKTASNIGGRLAGAGLNVAQGIGMDIARGTPTTLGSVALDVATGLAGGKGQFETGGIKVKGITNKVYTRDKNVVNEFMQRFATKISPKEYDEGLKLIKTFEQPYSLTSHAGYKNMTLAQKYELLNNTMNEMAKNWADVKMGFAQEDRNKLKNVVDKGLDIGDPINPDVNKINQAIKNTDDIYNGLLKAPKDKDFINKVKALRARYNEQLIKVAGADISSDYKTNYAAYQQVRGTNSPQVPLMNKLEENISKLDEIISNKGKIPKVELSTQPIKTGGVSKVDGDLLKAIKSDPYTYLKAKIPDIQDIKINDGLAVITTKNGNKINLGMTSFSDGININNIEATKKGTGDGTKIIRALQEWTADKGGSISINRAANEDFWKKSGFSSNQGGGEFGWGWNAGNKMAQSPISPESVSPIKTGGDDLLNEARKYSNPDDFVDAKIFRDAHSAPRFDKTPVKQRMEEGGDYNLLEVVKGQHNQPSDYFDTRVGPRYYMYDDQQGMESLTAINNVKRGAKTVTAYRVVPKDVKVDKLIDGDWISFSKQYALDHGEHRFGEGAYKIIKQEVPAKDVWWDGNDIREWGYDTGKTKELSRSELKDIWNQAHNQQQDFQLPEGVMGFAGQTKSNLSPESKGIKIKPNDDLVTKFDETIKVSPNENKLSLNNQENQGILSADQKIRVKSEPKIKVQPYQTSTSQPIISNEPFIDKNGELQFPGIDDEFKAFIGEGRPKVKGPFETPDLDTSKTGIAKGTILGGGAEKASPEVKQSFATWVNARRASQVEGIIKSREFKDLDSKGIDGIFEFQAGDKSGKFKALKDYFDTKFNQANTEGIKINYKQDYLPQMWNNSTEEVNQVFGNRLGLKPSFTIESLIKDYKTGIEQGLTPKFTKISDLVASYEARVNKSIADRKFFDGLKTDNIILPANKAPLDWVTLDPDRFPKLSLSTDQGQYTGIYKAPEDIGRMINNYLADPSTSPNIFLKGMNSIANWISSVKNRVLSFGIPGTAINAHGFNILSRNIMSSRNPIEGAFTGLKYMLNPNSAMKDLEINLKDAPEAVKNGLTLSANEFKSVLDEPQGIRGKVGDVWNKLFEKGLFDKMLPALKLQKYKEVKNGFIKGGMNESEAGRNAAKFINTTFGGMNWEELGKSRDWQNFKRITILAPDWLGTNIKLAGKLPQSFLKMGDKTLAPYRRFTATFLGTYITMNVVNKLSSGHWMYQNDPGNTFNIEAGYTEDGKKRYIRPFGTAADFARLPVDVISGLVKGDISVIPRLIRNRLSIPAGVGLGALTDTDYTGQPIGYRGKDKYGNEIPLKQRAMGMGGELATLAGMPAFAKQGLDYLGGKVSGEEALLQGFELPVRYSGGAYTKTQKEIRDSFKVKGATGQELYDINKQIKGQTFGENQKAEIISSGREKITEILQEKEKNKIIDQAREEVKNTGQTTEVQGIVLYKDKQLDTETGEYKTVVKSIDLSKPINKPNLTGNKEVDKKMTSSYNSKITSRINDIVKLVELEKLDADTAEKMIAELKKTKLSTGSKKGKKITAKIIKITSPKANIKFSSPRASKFKLKPSPKIKITKTDNRKYTIKA